MPELEIRKRSGGETSLTAEELSTLARNVRGDLLFPATPPYEAARRIWNAMIDHRPGLIVRCRSAADVIHTIRFARERDILVAIRGGGHNIAGNAIADRGLVIDLSPMRGVRVDPQHRRAWVEPGTTLGEMDHDTQTFGLATPLGINSTTGVAGLTLGGGYGWLSRKHGLTVDNLIAADVVTADGELLTVGEREYADLYWAIRGGGGNFGVVTSFTFGLHPVGPTVLAGLVVYPFERAREVLKAYRDIVARAPDSLTAWIVMRKAPPLPFLAKAVHGREVVIVALCHSGDVTEAEVAARPLRTIVQPHADIVKPMPYTAFQSMFDPLLTPGMRNYWKTNNFMRLSDRLVDTLLDAVGRLPTPQCEIFLANLGGAVSRREDDATAYAGRAAQFVMNVHGRWESAADDERVIGWARDVHRATSSYAASNAYVNFLTADEHARVRDAYGGNYERLAAIKAKYDPTNMFRVNQNIVPASAAESADRSVHRSMATPASGSAEAPVDR